MKYNLKNYLGMFQRATALHPGRNVILRHASPQFRDARFLPAAAKELHPVRTVHLRQACEALSQTGFIGTTSSVDRTVSQVTFNGCRMVTPSAFEALAKLVSFDFDKIPAGHTIVTER